MTKTCRNPACAQQNPQPLSEFKRKARYRDGVYPQCRACGRKQEAAYRDRERDKLNAYNRERYRADPAAACRKSKGCRFRQKYWPHLTAKQALAEWDRLFQAQGGRCDICKKDRPLDVDHCHVTGQVRALLCNGCNTAIARVDEDFNVALGVAKYIQRHKDVV